MFVTLDPSAVQFTQLNFITEMMSSVLVVNNCLNTKGTSDGIQELADFFGVML